MGKVEYPFSDQKGPKTIPFGGGTYLSGSTPGSENSSLVVKWKTVISLEW